MKKGITYRSFPGGSDGSLDPVEAMREAKRLGFESIEPATGVSGRLTLENGEPRCRELRDAARGIGIELSSLATVLHWKQPFTHDDPEVRAQSIESTRRVLQQAAWLGVDAVLVIPGHVDVFFDPAAPVVGYDHAYERTLEALRSLRADAERLKVALCIENVWNRFLLSPLEFRDLIDRVESPWVGAYFDVGNCFLNGYPEQWIRILGKRIRRIHVKDFDRSVGTIDGFCPIFEGGIDWAGVMGALREIGYDGFVSGEMIPPRPGDLEKTSAALDSLLSKKTLPKPASSVSACPISNEEELEDLLSRPTQDLHRLDGDLVILGAGGKMGPTLARMAARSKASVIAVSRRKLDIPGVRSISCDLLNREAVRTLPDAAAVIYMAGMKFGTAGAEAATWAMNAVAPANAAERYRGVPTVVFSTGNVYPFVPVASGGATEQTPPGPVGEYAQSCLARERVFEHYASPLVIFRLNYAVELRYGVLLDVALKVRDGRPVDLSMGYANVIWQRDANAVALRCISLAESPPLVLNVTGPETISIQRVAERFGELLGKPPRLEGREANTALLSNASKALGLFGPPSVSTNTVIDWVACWVKAGGATLGKPTHFETRDGNF